MDALQIRKAALVGHSFLGVVAATFAMRCPDRVTKLVLADACSVISMTPRLQGGAQSRPLVDGRSRKMFTRQLLYDGALDSRLDGVWLLPDSKDSRRAFYRNCRKILALNVDYFWLLGQVRSPTLVLGGSCDRLVPPKGIRKYGELIRARKRSSSKSVPTCPTSRIPISSTRKSWGSWHKRFSARAKNFYLSGHLHSEFPRKTYDRQIISFS